MKTVIIDNSLCTLPIAEGTSPELICRYIHALAETGVKYVELDFRTVMKMQELPDCVEYIFRLGDPMFAQLTQAFDFRYVVVTMHDIKDEIDVGNTPVILEIPRFEGFNRKLQALAQKFVSGPISMIRVRSSFDFMNIEQAKELVWRSKSAFTVPIDVCPMDAKRTALDTALKVSNAGVDSMTLCMGKSKSYASLEDFLFTMTMVFNSMPKEYSIPALCKAEAYHRIIFGLKSADRITEIMEHVDYDISHLTNTDTGNRVKMHVSLKDRMMLRRSYVSALQRFAEEEDIPEDIAQEIFDAIDHFDMSLYDQIFVQDEKNKILN